MKGIAFSREVFIDPTPVTPDTIMRNQLDSQFGGAAVAVIIITCGGKLGSMAIVTTGTAIVTIAD